MLQFPVFFSLANSHIANDCTVHVLQTNSIVKGRHLVCGLRYFLDIQCELNVNKMQNEAELASLYRSPKH